MQKYVERNITLLLVTVHTCTYYHFGIVHTIGVKLFTKSYFFHDIFSIFILNDSQIKENSAQVIQEWKIAFKIFLTYIEAKHKQKNKELKNSSVKNLQFASFKRQNYLLLKLKKSIQRSDSIPKFNWGLLMAYYLMFFIEPSMEIRMRFVLK